MNRKKILAGVLALALVACGDSTKQSMGYAASALPSTQELNIYEWSDYVDPDTVKAFEKDKKITINKAFYDSNEVLESKILTGKTGYDLVMPSLANVGRQIQAGAYQKINKNQIPNYGNIDPDLLKLMEQVDAGNQYAVPYFWGINTLAINKDLVNKALGTDKLPENEWDLVFNPEYTQQLKSCGISFFDSPTEQIPLVLNYLGKNPNSEAQEDVQAAFALLKMVHHDVKRYTSSGYIDDLAKGELCVVIGYGGDLNIAKRRAQEANNGVNIAVLTPKSGVGIWIDSFVIPRDADNVANAYQYINYTLDPQVAAKNGDFVTYAPASKPARALMDKQFADDTSIFPTEAVKEHSFVVLPKSPAAVKFQTKMWQALKAGK